MITWYQLEHPHSCLDKHDVACKTQKNIKHNPNGTALLFFHDCFPNLTQLPLAFSREGRDILNKTRCIDLAYKAIQGRIVDEKVFRYMQYNTNYYYTKTIDTYPSKGVLVARTESLWDDIQGIDLGLGGNGSFGVWNDKSHGSNDTLPLSVGDSALLCCAMQEEMHAFRRLLDRAVNLDEASKQATISSAAQRCGFPLWNEMVEFCASNDIIFGMRQISNQNPAKSLLPASPPLSYDNILFCHIGKCPNDMYRLKHGNHCNMFIHTHLYILVNDRQGGWQYVASTFQSLL